MEKAYGLQFIKALTENKFYFGFGFFESRFMTVVSKSLRPPFNQDKTYVAMEFSEN